MKKLLQLIIVVIQTLICRGLEAQAQLSDSCYASVLNRVTRVNNDGSYIIRNIPVEPGRFRIRFSCEEAGVITRGHSEFVSFSAGATTNIQTATIGSSADIPTKIQVSPSSSAAPQSQTILEAIGASRQLSATATYPTGSTSTINTINDGSIWLSSNPSVVSVTSSGVITAQNGGSAIITVRNEGVQGSITVNVDVPSDTDGDGMSDAYELANGLNPFDSGDAAEDRDSDGLSNLEEFLYGSDLNSADTDGDGLTDGEEVNLLGSNPADTDSDNDGLSDGDELLLGTSISDSDSDNDGILDGIEANIGSNPLIADPTTTVQGVVKAVDGAGAPNATVIAFGSIYGTTNASGAFTLFNVPANHGNIVVNARKVFGSLYDFGVSGSLSPIVGGITNTGNIQLVQATSSLVGIVKDPLGLAVAGAHITVTHEDGGVTNITSAFDGSFILPQTISGLYVLDAIDPGTGLRGRSLAPFTTGNTSSFVTINLLPRAIVEGSVFDSLGDHVGAGVHVKISGPGFIDYTSTDYLGRYRFGFVPLGQYQIIAGSIAAPPQGQGYVVSGGSGGGGGGGSNGSGNPSFGGPTAPVTFSSLGEIAKTAVSVATTNQILTSDLSYIGRGTVSGIVLDGTGLPVPMANVRVTAEGIVSGYEQVMTDASGEFLIDDVFVGPFEISAWVPSTPLAAITGGRLSVPGQLIDLIINLSPSATITGTVNEFGGNATSQGGSVYLSPSGRVAFIDTVGNFIFENVPLGSYTLTATVSTFNKGSATTALNSPGSVSNVPINLLGLGTVNVHITDGGGVPAIGTAVTLNGTGGFPFSRFSTVSSSGTAEFANVLAGPVSISASNYYLGSSGSTTGTISPDTTSVFNIQLGATGSISGQVLDPNGIPTNNIQVRLDSPMQTYLTAGSGYNFPYVPLTESPFVIQAFDSNGSLRGTASGITLQNHGEAVVQNITLSGVGTVNVLVFNPDGSAAQGVIGVLDSEVSGFNNQVRTSNSSGAMTFQEIPVGAYDISFSHPASGSGAGESGIVHIHNEQIYHTVFLVAGQISQITTNASTRYDGNAFEYKIQNTGALKGGHTGVFNGDNSLNKDAARLTLYQGTVPTVIVGSQATSTLGSQLISIPANGPQGLTVERNIYVPEDGYFARYIDQFSNTTSSSITFSARNDSNFRYIDVLRPEGFISVRPRITLTSSSDDTLNSTGASSDNWAIIDDDMDVDPFKQFSIPAVGILFDGNGATTPPTTAEFTFDDIIRYGKVDLNWNNITVPPGGSVGIMYFITQQTSRAAAQNSLERLIQLPPEALVGITESQRASIINFSIPSLVSTLPALPSSDSNVVSGSVLESLLGIGITNSEVKLKSDSPFFGRTYSKFTNAAGAFSFASNNLNNSNKVTIPDDSFTLEAIHPTTASSSGVVATSFPPNSNTATQNLSFSQFGAIHGTVEFANNIIASSGAVNLNGNGLNINATIQANGTFQINALPAGSYLISAMVPHPQGTGIGTSLSINVNTGVISTPTIILPPTGDITGVVSRPSGPVVNMQVQLLGTNFTRSTNTNSGGIYSLNTAPAGSYTLRVIDSLTGITVNTPVVIAANSILQQNVSLAGIGTISLQANLGAGGVAPLAPVSLQISAIGSQFNSVGSTNILGQLNLINIPTGNFQIIVSEPGFPLNQITVSGTIPSDQSVVPLTIVIPDDLPPIVSITSPIAGAGVIENTVFAINATATDNGSITNVAFYINNEFLGNDSSAPYTRNATMPACSSSTTTTLKAVATDNIGQTTEVMYNINCINNMPPSVTITAPLAGTNITELTNFTFSATATDDAGILNVRFLVNGVDFGTDTSAPYSKIAQLQLCPGGSSAILQAIVTDIHGATGTNSINVNCLDDPSPSLTILGPTNGASLYERAQFLFQATASDTTPGTVANVKFYRDGTLLSTDTSSPYQTLTTLVPCPGGSTVNLSATATDNLGQITTATVTVNCLDNLPPTVSISSPIEGALILPGSTINVTASDPDQTIASVCLLTSIITCVAHDYTAPYTLSTSLLPSGTQTVTVVAIDTLGENSTASVNITINGLLSHTMTGTVVDDTGLQVGVANVHCGDGAAYTGQFASTTTSTGTGIFPNTAPLGQYSALFNISSPPFPGQSYHCSAFDNQGPGGQLRWGASEYVQPDPSLSISTALNNITMFSTNKTFLNSAPLVADLLAATNWSGGTLPTVASNTVIEDFYVDRQVFLNTGAISFNRLRIEERLDLSGGTLTVNDFSEFKNDITISGSPVINANSPQADLIISGEITSTGSPAFQANNGGKITFPSLDILDFANLSVLGSGSQINFPNLVQMNNTKIQAQSAARITVPISTNFDISGLTGFSSIVLYANDNSPINPARISFPNLLNMTFGVATAGTQFQSIISQGSGVRIELPSLTTINLSPNTGADILSFSATSGAYIDLSALTTITSGAISFNATGANSIIDLSSLTSFPSNITCNEISGGTVILPPGVSMLPCNP